MYTSDQARNLALSFLSKGVGSLDSFKELYVFMKYFGLMNLLNQVDEIGGKYYYIDTGSSHIDVQAHIKKCVLSGKHHIDSGRLTCPNCYHGNPLPIEDLEKYLHKDDRVL